MSYPRVLPAPIRFSRKIIVKCWNYLTNTYNNHNPPIFCCPKKMISHWCVFSFVNQMKFRVLVWPQLVSKDRPRSNKRIIEVKPNESFLKLTIRFFFK